MDNRNYKEFFALNALLVLTMIGFGMFGFGFFGGVCATAIMCFFMLKNDIFGVAVSAVLTFLTDAMVSMSFNYTIVAAMIFCAAFINLAVREKRKLLYTVSSGVLGVFVAFAAVVLISEMFGIAGMRVDDIKAGMNIVRETVFQVVKTAYGTYITSKEADMLTDLTYMSMVPSCVIAFLCVYSYLTIAVLKKIGKKCEFNACDYLVGFTKIKADKMCALILAVSFIGYILTFESNIRISAALMCMLILTAGFYWICGISVVASFAKRAQGGRKAFLYVFLVVGAVLFAFAMFITGIVDSFADMRKIAGRR